MKKHILLFLLSAFSFVSFSQNIKKQIEDLDTAYYHNDLVGAKKLIAILSPDAPSKIKEPKELIEFYSTCGSVYYGTGEYADAENYFSLAAERSKAVLPDSDYHYSLAIFNLASCYKEEGRYAEAEPLYLKSLPILSNAFGQTSLEYTRCYYTVGSLYVDMGKYDYAEGMVAAVVNFYKTILGQESDDYLGALGSMGLIYQGQGKYDKAEQIFLALKNYFQSLKNPDKETLQTLENNLGELYRNMGDYEKAEPAMLEAVKLSTDNTVAAATSLNNLALTQKALGKYSEAEVSYKKSITIYKNLNKTNHPDYTNPVNNLGELYRVMGRTQEAIDAFEEVIAIRKKLLGTDHPNYANALNNLALVEFGIGRYPDAEKHLLECRDIYKRTLGDKDKFYANSLNNLASVYKAEGKLPEAEENYKECLKIYKETYGETSDKYGVYLGGLAGTYRQMKKYDECIELTKKSLEIIKNKLGENHYDYIETDYNLAETYRESENYVEAEKHYLSSIQGYLFLIEKYFPSLSEKEKTSFYYTISSAFETYNSFVIQMVNEFPKQNHDALISRMYDNQLIIKSLLLKETGKIKIQIAASENKELKQDYEELIKMREDIVKQYRLSAEDLLESGIDLPKMEKDANELEQKITSASNISMKKDDSSGKSWKDIQAKLKADECAIEIVRTNFYTKGVWTDSIYYSALIVNKTCKVPEFVFIKNGTDLENKTAAKYRACIKAKTEDIVSYNAFWKPLKDAVGASKKIYFSPDGIYQQVNMYTLKNPETQKYLIEETNISLVTNTQDLLQSAPASTSKNAEIFSYPDYDFIPTTEVASSEPLSRYGFSNLPELPGTKIEADSITNILRSKNWKVNEHLQKEATEDAIKKIKDPQILHIATHGFFLKDVDENASDVIGLQSGIVKENPLLRSGLMLAGAAAVARDSMVDNTKEDGILTAYEAAGLNLSQTDLVVLSACETGLGEVFNGQGVYGLQRAFMVAGAKSVIMSLWVVDDFATQELMSNFYREWLKDPTAENKQKAFRTAQLKLRERFPQPYYWGAFVMVGK